MRAAASTSRDLDTGRFNTRTWAVAAWTIPLSRCKDYKNRSEQVDDCGLSADNVAKPKGAVTCGYRPLATVAIFIAVSAGIGHPATVHAAGISVRGRVAISEENLGDEDYEDRCLVAEPCAAQQTPSMKLLVRTPFDPARQHPFGRAGSVPSSD
jgi:uncharacterized cysteine cluster protein YcgN (CxxCxxCC family)